MMASLFALNERKDKWYHIGWPCEMHSEQAAHVPSQSSHSTWNKLKNPQTFCFQSRGWNNAAPHKLEYYVKGQVQKNLGVTLKQWKQVSISVVCVQLAYQQCRGGEVGGGRACVAWKFTGSGRKKTIRFTFAQYDCSFPGSIYVNRRPNSTSLLFNSLKNRFRTLTNNRSPVTGYSLVQTLFVKVKAFLVRFIRLWYW